MGMLLLAVKSKSLHTNQTILDTSLFFCICFYGICVTKILRYLNTITYLWGGDRFSSVSAFRVDESI